MMKTLNNLMPQSAYARQQKTIFWIIGIGLFLLLAANALGWIYLQRIKSFFISDLKFRLENIAGISARLIDAADLPYIIPESVNAADVLFYQNLLFDLKENNHLQDIYILSPAMETLLEISPKISGLPGHRIPERQLVIQALLGQTVTSELQTLGKHKFLTAVKPLFDNDNTVTGLLVIEAPAEFFNMLDQFDRGVLIFSFLNSILIISVAFFLFRSVRRVLHLQSLMKNQEHLVKLGEMASTVAHELRNPLGIIKGTNALIQKKYARQEDEIFTYIPDELNRLNALIENFLLFSRSPELNPQTFSMEDLFNKIKIGVSGYKHIRFNFEIPEKVPVIKTDLNALEQVLLNILRNSIQALKNKENAQITVTCETRSKKCLFFVADNGEGIPPQLTSRIFDPFFTTKEKGSGLGLAISKKLTEQMGGVISVNSVPGIGTTIIISLPCNG